MLASVCHILRWVAKYALKLGLLWDETSAGVQDAVSTDHISYIPRSCFTCETKPHEQVQPRVFGDATPQDVRSETSAAHP